MTLISGVTPITYTPIPRSCTTDASVRVLNRTKTLLHYCTLFHSFTAHFHITHFLFLLNTLSYASRQTFSSCRLLHTLSFVSTHTFSSCCSLFHPCLHAFSLTVAHFFTRVYMYFLLLMHTLSPVSIDTFFSCCTYLHRC